MKLTQITKLAVLTLCAGSLIWTAQATPKPAQLKKEQNVSASRLRVGDVIHAIHGGTHETVFDGKATAKVVSLSPLTINLNGGKTSITAPKGSQKEIGDFVVMTVTGQRSGFIAFVTVTKPSSVKFTRLAK